MRASGDRAAAAALGRRALDRHLDGRVRVVDSRGRIVLPRERQPRRTFVGPLLIIGAAPARAAQLVKVLVLIIREGLLLLVSVLGEVLAQRPAAVPDHVDEPRSNQRGDGRADDDDQYNINIILRVVRQRCPVPLTVRGSDESSDCVLIWSRMTPSMTRICAKQQRSLMMLSLARLAALIETELIAGAR